jgi:hypothetical protein
MSDKIGDMLLQAGLISNTQLSSALDYQKAIGGKLGVILVKLNFIREDRLAEFLSQQQKIPVIHLRDRRIDPALMKLLPRDVAEKNEILPLSREGDTLTVVTADPTDYPIIDQLAFMIGLKIQTVLATRSEVTKALHDYYYGAPAGQGKAAQPGVPAPAGAMAAPSATGASASATKRGRAGGGGMPTPAPIRLAPSTGPLEEKPINISPDKLARALAGLLIEKKVITLGELMDRVGREG